VIGAAHLVGYDACERALGLHRFAQGFLQLKIRH
jgi:hypothetical protein